jgi:hypothetical protein
MVHQLHRLKLGKKGKERNGKEYGREFEAFNICLQVISHVPDAPSRPRAILSGFGPFAELSPVLVSSCESLTELQALLKTRPSLLAGGLSMKGGEKNFRQLSVLWAG